MLWRNYIELVAATGMTQNADTSCGIYQYYRGTTGIQRLLACRAWEFSDSYLNFNLFAPFRLNNSSIKTTLGTVKVQLTWML